MNKIFLATILMLNISLMAMDKSPEEKLRQAVCQDDEKLVTELIQSGVSPDIMINIGEESITLLGYTVYKQYSNLFEKLITLRADVNHKEFSILHWIAKEHLYFKSISSCNEYGNYSNVILERQIYKLICSGVNISRHNSRGKFAYDEACANNFAILVNALFAYNAFLGKAQYPSYKEAGQLYKKHNEDVERQYKEEREKQIRELQEEQRRRENECCTVM